MRSALRTAAALGLLLSLPACQRPAVAPPVASAAVERPAGAPQMRGTVTRLTPLAVAEAARTGSTDPAYTPREGDVGLVLLEERPGAAGGGRDQVRVTRGTRVLRSEGGRLIPADWGDLRVGQLVEAWYAGPVAESYPRQAVATTLVLLPGSA